MTRQQRLIEQMTDKEILLNLYLSQAIMFVIAVVLGFFLFERWVDFWAYFHWDVQQIFLFGGGAALFVLLIDFILYRTLPKAWMDDGGINERVFRNRSVPHIFFLAFVVAVAEETLFRGVLQTQFGLFAASAIFALIHFRYLQKPVLFLSVLLISFLLGWLFLVTGNLLVTIFAHFLIDCILGLVIRQKPKHA
ncbi:CPBP family intramembrane glutamic endopeptidase [Halalkalibacterium ligniniphilum]|uniref:CPBP family intramembrane glutamic endopeptidase n=1 Tax=Halalkalibacterium ligniniphilum TaxID=1134413 RepID=UPI00034C22EC|nr:type II CAAX endopeptidase family protein [Halalkalibacterium ligniniphilum]